MIEVWKHIGGYEGLYEVSNFGRVKSFHNKNGVKFLKGTMNHGYCRVHLRGNNKAKSYRVHRLVAQAFLPNPENKPWINHLDSDRLNNHIANLEWCTPAENNRHSMNNGRWSPARGEKAGAAKLTSWQIRRIKLLRELGFAYRVIAPLFGIHRDYVGQIVRGERWQHLTQNKDES